MRECEKIEICLKSMISVKAFREICKRYAEGTNVVVIEPDVVKYFPGS